MGSNRHFLPRKLAAFARAHGRKAAACATFPAEEVCAPWALYGLDLAALTCQTDMGSEFLENQDQQGLRSSVRALSGDLCFILPKRYTWQRDVEPVHRLVEDERFDRETLSGPADCRAKTTKYHRYFNLVRPPAARRGGALSQSSKPAPPGLRGPRWTWRNPTIVTCLHVTTGVTVSPAFPPLPRFGMDKWEAMLL